MRPSDRLIDKRLQEATKLPLMHTLPYDEMQKQQEAGKKFAAGVMKAIKKCAPEGSTLQPRQYGMEKRFMEKGDDGFMFNCYDGSYPEDWRSFDNMEANGCYILKGTWPQENIDKVLAYLKSNGVTNVKVK